MPFCDVSSTLVRVNCNFGFDNSAYLPRPVDAYIKEKGLYCDFKPMVTKLRALQNRDRFEHTYNVVLAGLEIARKTNLDESEVFVACLLHDCAKNIPCSEWRRYGFDNGENRAGSQGGRTGIRHNGRPHIGRNTFSHDLPSRNDAA